MRPDILLLIAALAGCARAGGGEARPRNPAPAPPPPADDTAAVAARPAQSDSARRAAVPPLRMADPLADEAAAVVDRQHAAYNRHDLEGFLATYGDSVVVQTLGDTVPLAGKAALRESTEGWFREAPGARVELVQRMLLGPFVVDRQRVSGGTAGKPLEAIGIYEVREGLIRRVWTIPPPPTPH